MYYELLDMTIVFSEIYNPSIHGSNTNCLNSMDTLYMVSAEFSLDEFYNDVANNFCEIIKDNYYYLYNNKPYIRRHPNIRNYENIISNSNYYTLDIAKSIMLFSGEVVCYLKTFWLKLFQRKYKKYYIQKMNLIKKRKNIRNLLNKELTGKW